MANEYTTRRARLGDADAIYLLIKHFAESGLCVMTPRPKEEIVREIDLFNVCAVGSRPVGCGRIKRLASVDDSSDISSFCMRKDHQKKGLGSKLLMSLIERSETDRIFVETTDPTTSFFEKNGFKIVGPLVDVFYGKISSDYKNEILKFPELCERFPHNCPGILLEFERHGH